MIYCLHTPAFPLSDYVNDIFYYEAEGSPYEAEKLLPDNTIYLIINFTSEEKKLFQDSTLTSFKSYKKAWVSGMQKKYLVIESAKNNCMMVVRFKPGMAYSFFRVPLSTFSDIVLESDDIMNNRVLQLREELMYVAEPLEKCKQMELFLNRQLLRAGVINPVIPFLVEQLSDISKQGSIRNIIQKTGYSHKHVIQLFEKYVGLTPKHFARIAKFQQVLSCVDNQQYFNWTSLAHEYGFYDQAHFINEFKHFSGVNPSSYMLAKGETYNYLPVNYVKS